MEERPAGIQDSEVRHALKAWGIDPVSWEYAPVGFGDYHWTTTDTRERRWFVTVADLAAKSWYGDGPEAAFHGLRDAMDTAVALRGTDPDGLDFVVAPVRTAEGETVREVGAGHAVSVFPLVPGTPGHFGEPLTARDRGLVLDLLARLHRTTPPASARVLPPEFATRPQLEGALREMNRPWDGFGPYAEPARQLLAIHGDALRGRLDEFDRRAGELRASDAPLVVTHGEPHPGNLLRAGERRLLLDWDTVGLAVPERDLWLVAGSTGSTESTEGADGADGADGLVRYEEATGRKPDPSALALYRLRWALNDVAEFLTWLRAPHAATPDARQAWDALTSTVESLAAEA
ncbi:aminoglycoside phosphotransferase family protein [Streptomyces sp. NPDC006645]|uniref:aminoglycoside phosphotransferase family protein n=1 Tax=unclassified Streptomyces TaxID=2593676 RepID=UPI0033B13E94